MGHTVYAAIVRTVKTGRLREPFSSADFKQACPGFAPATYGTFLAKHARGNPGGNSELFVRVAQGRYRCIRPFKYGF